MKKLFLLLLTVVAFTLSAAAQRTVTGTVVYAGDGEPLAGATILPVGGGNGVACAGIAGRILDIKLYILAQLLGQGVHEALGRSVQRDVLNQLENANFIFGGKGGGAAEHHTQGKNQGKQLLHRGNLLQYYCADAFACTSTAISLLLLLSDVNTG